MFFSLCYRFDKGHIHVRASHKEFHNVDSAQRHRVCQQRAIVELKTKSTRRYYMMHQTLVCKNEIK